MVQNRSLFFFFWLKKDYSDDIINQKILSKDVGIMAEKKEKRYVSDNARLMAEWNWEKNTDVSPSQLTLGSHKKILWKCSAGHEWDAAISDRNNGTGCPYCSSQKILEGFNDLNTVNPTLAAEWNFEKNKELTPADVMPNSHKKVWWRCSKGHEWSAKISHRNNGIGCPYCSGKKVLSGYNDLNTINPNLAKEWNCERNFELTPMQVLPNSGKKVWWKCNKGHEWQARIADRNKGIGCPFCSSERQTSFPEYALIFYLKKYGIEAIHLYQENGYELDVFIPSKKIAIEYDGYYWHKSKEDKDLKKNCQCKNDGIKLFRVREGLSSLNDSSIDYIIHKRQKDLSEVLGELLKEIIGFDIDIDLKRDVVLIENLREHMEKECSILIANPEVSNEWNYEKNILLKPEDFSANSNKKVWWKCNKGHEWQARIADRNKGYGCPFCTGRYVITGENDLQTLSPSLASEWNYERNNEIFPTNISPHSHKKVWWKCSKGHEWPAIIKHRYNGSGCPYCSGRYAVNGENDLQTINPTLAKEWNYEKNDNLLPTDVLPNSTKKVWWRCKHGHEWQATIISRNRGGRCPECVRLKKKSINNNQN